MSQPNPFQLQPLQPVKLKDVFIKYRRNGGWFILSVMLCVILAFFYLRYATTQYRVNSTILLKSNDKGADMSQVGDMFSDLEIFNGGKNIDDEIEVLKGKTLMLRVLRELNLTATYYKEGKIKKTEVYGRSLPVRLIVKKLDSLSGGKSVIITPVSATRYTWDDGSTKKTYPFGREISNNYGVFTAIPSGKAIPTLNESVIVQLNNSKKLVADYLRELTITPVNKNGNVLKLSLNTSVPQKGIDVLNKLVQLYNIEGIENKNEIAAKTISFIDGRLIYLVRELSGVEKDVENYKKKNDVTDISSESQQYLQNTGDYEKKLSDYEIQISILQSVQNYIAKQGPQFDLVPSSLSIHDATLVQLIDSYNQLQLQRKRILSSNYETSPVVINITDQLNALRGNILENIKNIKRGLIISRNALATKNVKFESLKKNVPSIERELLEIKRQQNIKENLYQYLLQKREEATLSKAAAVSNFTIIDRADVDDLPVKPQRSLILLLALIAGLVLPVIVMAIRNVLNDKVTTIDDIKDAEVPVLGEIIHILSHNKVLVEKNSRTVFSEMFRLLRSKLQLSATEDQNKVLLVTSTMSGEGKTFFSINMGATLALAGKKVLLMEFDLRKPKLINDMGLSAKLGITNYLVSDKYQLDDLIIQVPEISNLYVIGCGDVPPNPSELILSDKMVTLFEQLKRQFDHVIIDSPPVGLIADAYNLSMFADRTLYLIRYNYTLKEQVKIIQEIRTRKELRNMMLVLNDGRKENMQGYGDYGYRYSYGYTIDDKQPASWWKRLVARL
ncbi:GumC family protein [Mucilaginibacter defluvii]|uniref:non-specific protein-tyrosine kinase n=1 Tax=Mucilaginibacter defluvii TaxID=1196019 RepID=A0ABP9FPS2_9SPHI